MLDFLAPVDAEEDRDRAWGESIEDRDPAMIERAVGLLSPLFCPTGPFPVETKGLHLVPDSPTLVVGTHSGGLWVLDAWGLGWLWYEHFGVDRALHGLGHEMFFKVRGTGAPMARLGAVKAGPKVGIEALRDWRHDVAVLPGGDHDVYRPYADRFRVDFGGRKGYARLALEAGVPITPMAHSGAHETLVVLRRGERLARRMGIDKVVRARIFPISVSVPWGLTVGPWPFVPVPARFRYRFGRPVQIEDQPVPEPTRAQVDELDRRVQASIQRMLDQLRVQTPTIPERLRFGLRR